ncbi:MAG TPA: hypothetical protein VMV81_01475 [Phycisphaerae bacterium]|nr:hypothetical protein [Phycisphaerae bacterium]
MRIPLAIGLVLGLGALIPWILAGVWRRREGRRVRDKVATSESASKNARARDGVDWYLQGCSAARAGEMRVAARHFGMAHHADWRLQSAALLTFSALKTAEGDETKLLDQLVQTWHEMREPEILREPVDRLLIDSLVEKDHPPRECSDLGRLAWIVSSPGQRRRLKQLLDEKPQWAAPLMEPAHEG